MITHELRRQKGFDIFSQLREKYDVFVTFL